MVPLTYYGSTYHCEVGVISRPSIKLAGVDSLEADFRFKTIKKSNLRSYKLCLLYLLYLR